jgi:hypothetical protein
MTAKNFKLLRFPNFAYLGALRGSNCLCFLILVRAPKSLFPQKPLYMLDFINFLPILDFLFYIHEIE